MKSTRNCPSPFLPHPLTAIAMLLAIVSSALAESQSIRLHDQASVKSDQVRLRDVAELKGTNTQTLSEIVVATLGPNEQNTTVTLTRVRDQLSQHGVNWGKLSLRGYAQCNVTRLTNDSRLADDTGDVATFQAAPAPLIANPMEEISLGSTITLRERLIEFIAKFAETDPTELRITFADHDDPALSQSTWHDRYEFEPISSTALGRVPIVVRRFRDDHLVDSTRIMVDVAKRYMAAVATRSIGRGQMFTPGDVEIREVYLDGAATPVADLAQVIGETAGAIVRAGTVLYDDDLRSPLVARRGQLMTVRCISGGLVVKTVGRAKEDGSRGQIIQVRNERTREYYAVRLTGTQQGIAILDHDQNSEDRSMATPPIVKRDAP